MRSAPASSPKWTRRRPSASLRDPLRPKWETRYPPQSDRKTGDRRNVFRFLGSVHRFRSSLHLQNRILPASSKSLGFPALVIVPKAALPNEPFGSFSGGVLLTLKTSARNSKLTLSDIRNVLLIIRSASWSPGPRTGFRELLPMRYWPAAVKADL